MSNKTERGLSGIWFRYQDPETGKWGKRVFEDLPRDEQEECLKGKSKEWVESLAIQLADTITEIGNDLDLMSSTIEDTEG